MKCIKAVKKQKNKVNKINFLFLVGCLFFFSCENSAVENIKNKRLSIKTTPGNLYPGDTFEVVIDPNENPADSVTVQGSSLINFNPETGIILLSVSSVGAKSVSITAYKDENSRKATINKRVISKIKPIALDFEIVKVLDHDQSAYTQGYEFYKGDLLESRGQYGVSEIRKHAFPSNKLLSQKALEPKYFAEGLTVMNDTIYLLTWKSRKCFRYNPDLSLIDEISVPTAEGWGLCNDDANLFISDGSHILYKLGKSLNIKKVIEVYSEEYPLKNLNELEYVNGKIMANIYTTDLIYQIKPETGEAEAYLNLNSLRLQLQNPRSEVLNGIAYLADKDQYLVTGKYWDKSFLIRIK